MKQCQYCKRDYPEDPSAPTNLFCAGCRQEHHNNLEQKVRALEERVKIAEAEWDKWERKVLDYEYMLMDGKLIYTSPEEEEKKT